MIDSPEKSTVIGLFVEYRVFRTKTLYEKVALVVQGIDDIVIVVIGAVDLVEVVVDDVKIVV